MYVSPNIKSKKELKEAVAAGQKLTVFRPGLGAPPPTDGDVTVEGPHYPEPHRWYAVVTLKGGFISRVR